jgi:Malectin domain
MHRSNASTVAAILCFGLALHACFAKKVLMKVNLGGGHVGDFAAEEECIQLDPDMPKMRYHGEIAGHAEDRDVFKTQRFARAQDLILHFPVPDGVYAVTLLFAETWSGAFNRGVRVFDVYLGSKPNGIVKVLESMDMFAAAGGAKPIRRRFHGIVTKDGLTIALRPIRQNPQIAGVIIEGHSYQNAMLQKLPTLPRNPTSSVPDLSFIDRIVHQANANPALLYDPQKNPGLQQVHGTPNSAAPDSSNFNNAQAGISSFQAGPTSMQGSLASPTSVASASGDLAAGTHSAVMNSELSSTPTDGGAPFPPQQTNGAALPSSAHPFASSLTTGQHAGSYGGNGMTSASMNNGLSPGSSNSFAASPPELGGGLASTSSQQHGLPSVDGGNPNTMSHQFGSMTRFSSGGSLPASAEAFAPAGAQSGPLNPPMAPTGAFGALSPPLAPVGAYNAPLSATGAYGAAMGHYSGMSSGFRRRLLQAGDYSPSILRGGLSPGLNPHALGMNHFSHDIESAATSARQSYASAALSPNRPPGQEQATDQHHHDAMEPGTASRPQSVYGIPARSIDGMQVASSALTQNGVAQTAYAERAPAIPDYKVATAFQPSSASSSMGGPVSTETTSKHPWNGNSAPEPSQRIAQADGSNNALSLPQQNPLSRQEITNPATPAYGAPSVEEDVSGMQEMLKQQNMRQQKIFSGVAAADSSTPERWSSAANVGGEFRAAGSATTRDVSGQNAENTVHGSFEALNPPRVPPTSLSVAPRDMPALGGPPELPATLGVAGNPSGQGTSMFAEQAGTSRNDDVPGPPTSSRGHSSHMSTNEPGPPSMVTADEGAASEHHESNGVGIRAPGTVLDGICINNSTHCSCGITRRVADEQCLYVINESWSPPEGEKLCRKELCNAQFMCGCAAEAPMLCARRIARSILVQTEVNSRSATSEPTVVKCARQSIDQAVPVLEPVMG